MNGKSKCKILKQIRQEIAKNNDIEYTISECKFQGECSGTCPKCEGEVRYLEQELSKRRKAGKKVAVAGIAATLLIGSAGCALDPLPLDDDSTHQQTTQDLTDLERESTFPNLETEWDGVPELVGEVPYIEPGEQEWEGELEEILMGDVPFSEDQWEN